MAMTDEEFVELLDKIWPSSNLEETDEELLDESLEEEEDE